MTLQKKGKLLKALAMVIAVVMLASAMMVQAFAKAYNASGTLGGYSVSATISKPTTYQFRVSVTSGRSMLHDITLSGYFMQENYPSNTKFVSSSSTYNSSSASHTISKPDSTHTVAKQAYGPVTSTYNGSSLNLTTNYTYDG